MTFANRVLSLRKQGILLVALMLILELTFYGIQAVLLEQVETEETNIEETRSVIDRCNKLDQLLFLAARSGARYSLQQAPAYREEFVGAIAAAEAIFDSLRKSLVKSPEQLDKFDSVHRRFRQLVELSEQSVRILDEAAPGTKNTAVPIGLADRLRITGDDMIDALTIFLQSEHEILRESPVSERQQRVNLKKSLGVFIVIHGLAALAIAFYFFQMIVGKIDVIVSNAHRFGDNQDLLPPLKGEDELSDLDWVFHQSVDNINRERAVLEASEKRLRAIVELLPVGLIMLRHIGDSAIIEYANIAILKMLDYSPAELANKPISILFSRTDKGLEGGKSLVDLISAGKVFEQTCYQKDGAELHVEITAAEFATPAAARTLISILDVRERFEIQQLRQSFVSIVSHELRAPLTSVRGFLTLLKMDALGPIPNNAKESATRAESNVLRLINLINDLLDLEKVESGKITLMLEDGALSRLIGQAVDALKEFASEHEVQLISEQTDFRVAADPGRLVQVLVNLIANAIKYSPPGEKVQISCKDRGHAWCEISVINQGPGLPENQREAIFERFHQVGGANQKQGTGLGLAICKAIIEQHGGVIGVESEAGKGSRFWFTVPKLSD